VRIEERANPAALHVVDGRLTGLVATRTEYTGERDASGRKIPRPVPDSEFEIPLDTLILAISQHSLLDFFGDDPPALTPRGYIDVDPVTFESSIPGVYAGGDVAAHGPSSIVKAAADGKAAAAAIVEALGGGREVPSTSMPSTDDTAGLVMRRARREYRVPTRFTPLTVRNTFDETSLVFTAEEARAEASRCVDCDTICSLCVGVCPNIALMTYRSEPFHTDLPVLRADGSSLVAEGTIAFDVDQSHQIAVLTDFCNECGNCVTACPTSGTPYVDKPRLYLDPAEFEAETSNAFMIEHDGGTATVLGRFDGATHRLSVNGMVEYVAPEIVATFDGSFDLLSVALADGAGGVGEISLEPAATMFVLWKGLDASMPEIPSAGQPGTRIAAPTLAG
jgi:putative selenate reductase